jgi:hypothetical protein
MFALCNVAAMRSDARQNVTSKNNDVLPNKSIEKHSANKTRPTLSSLFLWKAFSTPKPPIKQYNAQLRSPC